MALCECSEKIGWTVVVFSERMEGFNVRCGWGCGIRRLACIEMLEFAKGKEKSHEPLY